MGQEHQALTTVIAEDTFSPNHILVQRKYKGMRRKPQLRGRTICYPLASSTQKNVVPSKMKRPLTAFPAAAASVPQAVVASHSTPALFWVLFLPPVSFLYRPSSTLRWCHFPKCKSDYSIAYLSAFSIFQSFSDEAQIQLCTQDGSRSDSCVSLGRQPQSSSRDE